MDVMSGQRQAPRRSSRAVNVRCEQTRLTWIPCSVHTCHYFSLLAVSVRRSGPIRCGSFTAAQDSSISACLRETFIGTCSRFLIALTRRSALRAEVRPWMGTQEGSEWLPRYPVLTESNFSRPTYSSETRYETRFISPTLEIG